MSEKELREAINELKNDFKEVADKLFEKVDNICTGCSAQKLECEKRFSAITLKLFIIGISCFLGGFGAAKFPEILRMIAGL